MENKKIQITSFVRDGVMLSVCALLEENRVVEMWISPGENEIRPGGIFLGQVQRILPSMNGIFVDIKQHTPALLPMNEQPFAYVPHKNSGTPLRPMDEVVVQVSREAGRKKKPCVTTKFSFMGDYMVMERGEGGIGISKKLGKQERERLRTFAKTLDVPERMNLTFRTAAGGIDEVELTRDFLELKTVFEDVIRKADSRHVFTLLKEADGNAYSFVREYAGQILEIKTDDPSVFEQLGAYAQNRIHVPAPVFYDDRLLPLYKLSRLETVLDEALAKKVWLKSGGFLVIEQTEAFVSVDVNSGKYSSKKKGAEDTYLKINLEAAKEIAVQLRLRNLSGMILIDFINLESPENRQRLLAFLAEEVKNDPVPTKVVDMTELGIVELTRKKIRKPLAEQIKVV